MSVTIRLEDEIDVPRGDMLVDPDDQPVTARALEATLCWMSERPLSPGRGSASSTRPAPCGPSSRASTASSTWTRSSRADATEMALNDIGRCGCASRPAHGRPVRREPRDRRVHPGRRGDERHRRRRHGSFAPGARACRVSGLARYEQVFYARAMRTEYREEPCRTALTRVKGMPFAWSLNPYTGCAHRCTFCYVRGFERGPSGRPTIATAARSVSRRTSPTCSRRSSPGAPGRARR